MYMSTLIAALFGEGHRSIGVGGSAPAPVLQLYNKLSLLSTTIRIRRYKSLVRVRGDFKHLPKLLKQSV